MSGALPPTPAYLAAIVESSDEAILSKAFTIMVPASAAEQGKSQSPMVSKDMAPERESLNGIRILVIEDEPDTREFLERFLRSYGADVVTARSAAEALSRSWWGDTGARADASR